MLVTNCPNCSTPVQLPPVAQSVRCTFCRTRVTLIGDACAAPPPLASHAALAFYNHELPGPPQNAHRRKRAVICGISYKNSRHELKGSINDAKCMLNLLVNKFRFPQDSIVMLTEEEPDPRRLPTKSNIRRALHWLVQGCEAGDSLVFHFSGHGSQQRDYSGDEADGYDETICPLDFETQGMIVDDEINTSIVKPIPHGVKLHAIVDASHSGTILDLPFLCNMNRRGQYVWEDQRLRPGVRKGTSGGEAICFSGCNDDQESTDTCALSNGIPSGAMTSSFIRAIDRGQGSTYGSILSSMRAAILNSGSVTGGRKRQVQETQLTASQPFDVYARPFSL